MRRIRHFFTRSFTERNPVTIGAIGVAVLLVAVLAAVFLNKNVFGGGETISARFVNAAGLRSGDQVLLAGVPVGSVTSLDERGRYVYAHMRVSGAQLPADTQADIYVQTLLGQVAVKLVPGHDWSHLMASGAMITATSVPTEFQDLQNTTSKLLSQSNGQEFNQMVTSLAKVTADKQVQVAQIIDGLNKLTSTINGRQAQVSQLIDASNQVAGALDARDGQLVSVVDNLGTVMNGLDNERQQVANLISGVQQVASQTASLVGDNRAKLDDALAKATTDLNIVAAHQVDLAQGIAYLGSALRGFSSIGFSGPNNTPNPSWSNTFTNLVGTGDPVLGSCGYLDQALDIALGPDPMPCKDRVGPPVTQSPAPGSSSKGSSGAPAAPSITSLPPYLHSLLGVG